MNLRDSVTALRNGTAVSVSALHELDFDQFRRVVLSSAADGMRVAALFGVDAVSGGPIDLHAVLAEDAAGTLHVAKTQVSGQFDSMTLECPQLHLFEREIAEQFGLHPQGHPWLKPVRFQKSLRRGDDPSTGPAPSQPVVGVTEYFRVEGDEVHEVAVGPVHAGVIEPGHFRFQCHGEEVFHLEISLGYQHRGVERAIVGGPNQRTVHYMETLAGDSSIAHTIAYCQAVEALAGCQVPARAEALRGIALELERLANHTGDLGALAGDVGFLPTASYCGRLRGDFLNATALLCGSRFGRGMVRPGGVMFDVDPKRVDELQSRLARALADVTSAVDLLWNTASVMSRFEDTGCVTLDDCNALGLVGPSARACGAERDVRNQFPSGMFRFAQIPISTAHTGDVFARAFVRWLEIQRSVAFIREQLESLPTGSIREPMCAQPAGSAPNSSLGAKQLAVSLVEGWRGEICHVAITDEASRLLRYKIVDPSFHNWMGLAMALRSQQISDFPLCNKSFNLSYCGFDL